MESILQKGWSQKQTQTLLEGFFPQRRLFSEKMSIADCFTCLCLAHSFLGNGNYRGADSKQSSVKCKEGLEKSHLCLHLTNITKATKNEQSRKNKIKIPTRTQYHFGI